MPVVSKLDFNIPLVTPQVMSERSLYRQSTARVLTTKLTTTNRKVHTKLNQRQIDHS